MPHTLIHTDRQVCGQTVRQMRGHSQPWSLCRGCCCLCGQGWRSFPSGCPGPETEDRIYPAHSETMRERGACFCGHRNKTCGQRRPSYTPNSMAARRKRRRQPCSSCRLDCQCSGDHEDETIMLKWNELIDDCLADSLHLHVVLHEWLALYSFFFLISTKAVYLQHWHGSCHMKLLPSRWKFCVHHTTMHHVTSCKATSASDVLEDLSED